MSAIDREKLLAQVRGMSLPAGPDFAWVEAHRPFIAAAVALIDAAPALPAGLPDVERLAAAARSLVDALEYVPGSMLGGKIALVVAALEGSATLPENVATAIGGAWTAAEAEAIARAYAAGHRDGMGCGIASGGLGLTECEHVGRIEWGSATLPQRVLWCERNESSASAHGHTDDCYRLEGSATLPSDPPSPDECPCCDGTGFVSDEVKARVEDANAELRASPEGQRFEAERAALEAGTHVPAVDDFGNQYLAPSYRKSATLPSDRGRTE